MKIYPAYSELKVYYIFKISCVCYIEDLTLNLLNELRKRDKMRGLSLFRNKFNKFNNTRSRMLDSIYHMTLRLL